MRIYLKKCFNVIDLKFIRQADNQEVTNSSKKYKYEIVRYFYNNNCSANLSDATLKIKTYVKYFDSNTEMQTCISKDNYDYLGGYYSPHDKSKRQPLIDALALFILQAYVPEKTSTIYNINLIARDKMIMMKEDMQKFQDSVKKQWNNFCKNIEYYVNSNEDDYDVEENLNKIGSEDISRIIVNEEKKIVVVIFKDNTKEVIKCSNEDNFSVYIGVALAIAKRYFTNNTRFHKVVDSLIEYQETKTRDIYIRGFSSDYYNYNKPTIRLTQEEYNLLKEVLKNDYRKNIKSN